MGEIVVKAEKETRIQDTMRNIMLAKIYGREPPETIWLTDTVYCGRKKIFRILGMGEHIPENAIPRIWQGILVGEGLQKLGIAGEVAVEYRGATGRIDVLLETGEPLEIKTTDNPYILGTNHHSSHVQQLSRYCLATGKETGVLLYYIASRPITSMPAIRYTFNLEEVARETDTRIDLLKKALEEKNPFTLPPTWHSKTFRNWECKPCRFKDICMAHAAVQI